MDAGDKNLRAILQDTVQAAEAFELDNKALRARLSELEESSNLRRIVQASHSSRDRSRSRSRNAGASVARQLQSPREWWQEELEEVDVSASLYDDGHSEIVRQLIQQMREMVPQGASAAQLRDIQVRLRTLASIIDSWQRKYADARQKAVGYLRDLDAVKSAQEEMRAQQSVAQRLTGDGWTNLAGSGASTANASKELRTYIALFEKEELPECDAQSDKAWVLDKYAQLRYRHRELFVRCELVQRENMQAAQVRNGGRLP